MSGSSVVEAFCSRTGLDWVGLDWVGLDWVGLDGGTGCDCICSSKLSQSNLVLLINFMTRSASLFGKTQPGPHLRLGLNRPPISVKASMKFLVSFPTTAKDKLEYFPIWIDDIFLR